MGLAVAALCGSQAATALIGLIVALACLLFAAFCGHSGIGRLVLVPAVLLTGLFSGLLLGGARIASLESGHLLCREGETARVRIVVSGPVRESRGWQSAVATVQWSDLDAEAKGEDVWFEVPPDEGVPLMQQGQIAECTARVEAPEEAGDAGFDQKRWLRQQGVCTVLKSVDARSLMIVGTRGGMAGAFDRLREAAREHLSVGPDVRVNEVLQGVVTGDTTGIDEAWLEAFRRSGTAHMLSVSGLHVASLAMIMIALARLMRTPRWVGFVLAAAAALLMIPFVGPSPPIIRAAVMIVIVLLGRWLGRGRDQWQVLALAAVVILTINPYGLFDVGFQLSFAALAGLMALSPRLQRVFGRLPAVISGNLSVSLAAAFGTAPVALAQFGRTSLVSPLANLLVVPTLPVVTCLGMASVFAGLLWDGLSVALDTLASVPMMWTVMISRAAARVPVLTGGDVGRAIAASVGGAVLLPIALACVGRGVRAPARVLPRFCRRGLAWVRRRRPKRAWAAWVVAAAVVGVGLACGSAAYTLGSLGAHRAQEGLGARSWPEDVEVRVLDVGQGNAVLVRTPQRHALLFDGGPEGCDLGGQLRSLGVRRLDAVVISHPHADHFAGLHEALDSVEIGTLVDHVLVPATEARGPPASGSGGEGAGASDEARSYLEFREALRAKGVEYALSGAGGSIEIDGVVVWFFSPPRPLEMSAVGDPWERRGGPPTGDELNAASLVAVVEAEGASVLLPGDAEADTLVRYELPPSDVLVVGHHGSKGAVSSTLLDRLGVLAGIVSVGHNNSFGHPDKGTIGLLDEMMDQVLRTDTAGWVSCRLKQGSISIATERTPAE